MVLSLKKREVLECANWTIKEKRLPNKFKIKMEQGFDINPLYDVLESLGMTSNYRDDDILIDDGFIVVEIWRDMKSVICFHDERDSAKEYPEITKLELYSMLNYERIDFLSVEDVDFWLKCEKGISFNN